MACEMAVITRGQDLTVMVMEYSGRLGGIRTMIIIEGLQLAIHLADLQTNNQVLGVGDI